MKIKICGLTDAKEAEYLNKNKVDYAGMVLFFPKSKRQSTFARRALISSKFMVNWQMMYMKLYL